MKEILKNFIQGEIDAKQKLLEMSNAMSDEDRTLVENAIQNLQTILEKVDEADDNSAAIEELKNTCEELNNSLTAVQEKLQQKQEDITQDNDTTMENTFLNTKESVHAFANAIRNAKTSDEFRKNWNDVLLENGITVASGSEAAFIPETVKGMISDIWDRNADWLKDLNYTGAKRFYCRYNTSDQTAENSRSKGWKKGDTKAVQTIALSAKLLEAQFIYKIQEIDLQTKWESDEALITYVLTELVDQILYEIKRAILVGDGRANDSDYKITKFEAVAKTSTDAYTTVSTVTDGGFLVDDMRAMVDSIHNPNGKPVYVFMSKASLRTLARVQASSTSTPVYIPKEQVADQIGATRIIDTDLLGDTFKAVAFIPSEYYMVGENILNPLLYTWHEGYKNLDCYRYECVAGGGINGMLSSAVLKSA
ncbi:MAG: hypothetical protein IKH15_08130 [Bacteroidales bacterium]|nr:hypothetical protein [Bacteroidales bacterium]MBR4637053.1 hypothetical protein [Bacteroidales bacterium]